MQYPIIQINDDNTETVHWILGEDFDKGTDADRYNAEKQRLQEYFDNEIS